MNTTHTTLYDTRELLTMEAGSEDAIMEARRIISQSAKLCLLCALALDSSQADGGGDEYDSLAVEEISSILMFKANNDLIEAEIALG